jgi:hypothetical protein
MAHKVFICHSSKDKAVADAACAALESHRIPCWIAPRDITPGDEYAASIIDALDECHIVLLIFSTHSNNSTQCRREIERAVSKEKILVPFRIEDVLPTRAMEFHLMNTHWLDALTPPVESRLTDLCTTVSRIIERHSPPSPPLWQSSPSTEARRAQEQADAGRQAEEDRIAREQSERAAQDERHAQSQRGMAAPAQSVAARHSQHIQSDLPDPPDTFVPRFITGPDIYSAPSVVPETRKVWWKTSSTLAFMVPLCIVGVVLIGFASFRTHGSPTPATTASTTRASTTPTPTRPSPYDQAQAASAKGDYATAAQLLTGVCANGTGTPAACVQLGDLYRTGQGVAADPSRAAQLYQQACKAGDENGCSNYKVLQAALAALDGQDNNAAAQKAARAAAARKALEQ